VAVAHSQHLAIKTYTTADGLSNNSVHKIFSDSRGLIWFATSEGLSRFNGYDFTTYGTAQGLPHPNVYSILESRAGVFWVGTGAGLASFSSALDPKSSSLFTTYLLAGESTTEVRALAEGRDGTIWVGTNGGLWRSAGPGPGTRFQPVDFRFRLLDLGIVALIEDAFQTLWIGTDTGVFRRWPDGHIAQYQSALAALIADQGVKTLRKAPDGSLLVGTGRGFMTCTPTSTGCSNEQFWDRRRGLSDAYVLDVANGAAGDVWVVSLSALTVVPWAPPGKARTVASRKDLGDFPLEAVASDHDGNLWVGSDGGGVSRFNNDGLVTYSEKEGLGSRDVISVFEDGPGDLLAVTRSPNGLFLNRYLEEKFQSIRLKISPQFVSPIWHGQYQVIARTGEGEWWVATHEGLARFSGIRSPSELSRAQPHYDLGDKDLKSQIIRLFRDGRDNLWISQQHSAWNVLVRWNPHTGRFERFPASAGGPDLANDHAQAYAEDFGGNLWIGLWRGGLWRMSSRGFQHYTLPKELLAGAINWLFRDHIGHIWVGSSIGGAARIDRPEDKNSRITRYTTGDGLSSDTILCITEDLSGYIYLCTGRGVDRLDPTSGHVKHFTTADGLAFGELQIAFRDKNGWLWFGTQQGLSRLIPANAQSRRPPPVIITEVNAGGRSAAISPAGEMEVSIPNLNPGQAQVEIQFAGLSLQAGEALRYQYRLDGSAKDWGTATAQRAVIYSGLRPGSYRFLVRAVNSEGLVSAEPARVLFTILPPIWMRWWFLLSASTTVGLAIASAWRYRQRQLAAVNRVRMRIAADLHDDIGSSLSQVAILSELVRRAPAPGVAEASGPLDQIADVCRELVDSMSDIVWATDPRRDRLGDLVQRMREFAGEVLGGSNIEFRFLAGGIEAREKLTANSRRQVFLIFKESVHNVIRHSRCTRAEASLEQQGNSLVLRIWDNGIGFDISRKHDGHGLASMRDRAANLRAEIKCSSGPDGTVIYLRVPLHG
jgi:ligand-binding sensor domain-containing protein/signal transduction histidine kinase